MKDIDLRELQKEEALKRMQMMNLLPEVVDNFKKHQELYKSEFTGVLYWLNEEEKAIVEEFEKTYGGMVFHIIKNYTEFGKLLSLLYVSKYPEEWEDDIELIKENIVFCFVKNLDNDHWSEFGSIGFKSIIGGIMRTA